MNDQTQPLQKRNAARRVIFIVWTLIIIGLLLGEIALLQKAMNNQQFVYGSDWLNHVRIESALLVWSIVLGITASLFLNCFVIPARFRRRTLIVLAWTVTIIALFYGEENFRGRHTWNKYRRELEARGEQLDLKAYIPKPIPDDQNFAATPYIQSWFVRDSNRSETIWGDHYLSAEKLIPLTVSKSRDFIDLAAWEMAFDAVRSGNTNSGENIKSQKLDLTSRVKAAPSVLEGLKTSEAHLAELRASSQRSSSQYPVVYDLENPWGILLPHLINIKFACHRLQLRACAELAVGQSEDALKDVKLMHYLSDSLKTEPILISYLVRIYCVQIAIQPVWEGLADHRWSDAQLKELQTQLQQYDFVADMKRPFDGERAAGILTADLLAAGKYRLNDLAVDLSLTGSTLANLLGRIAPRGWYHLEQLNHCRLYTLLLEGAFDTDKRRIFPRKLESNSKALEQAFAGRNPVTTICTRHQLLAVMLLPEIGKIPIKGARAQVAVDQAVLACALERYRLANGNFPESLDTLVPQFIVQLPHDVLTGEPYKYRLTSDGQFALYSVGWNEKDDGDRNVLSRVMSSQRVGDWVWQYPTK